MLSFLMLVSLPLLATADDDLTVANLNVLHGLGCSPDQCRLADRIDLMFEWVADAGCPDVVTFQEVNDLASQAFKARELIEAALPTVCGGAYDGNSAFSSVLGIDEEMVISRYSIFQTLVLELHSALAPGFTRHVLRVRIAHPLGPLHVFTTHLSSGSDDATDPCGANPGNPCPVECIAAGATTYRECQAVQLVDFVEASQGASMPAVVSGDLNAVPGSFEVLQLTGAGFSDTYLAVGNPECVPATGVGCTSGRDSSLAELESTAANVDRRIDYLFLVPGSDGGPACTQTLDTSADLDGDGTATQIFADDPNPFASCGPALDICWPSDHEGNEMDLNFENCSFVAAPALSGEGQLLVIGLLALAGAWGSRRIAKG
jgi:endonuclease/exonuclease/phosphatase family metal-dependent hydrolase